MFPRRITPTGSAAGTTTLATVLAAGLLALPATAQDGLRRDLTPEVSYRVVLEPGWDFANRAEGLAELSTDEAAGRMVTVTATHARRYLENRNAFARGARIESFQASLLGHPATVLRGQTNDIQSITLGRTRMSGTRMMALLDMCMPDGEPIIITMIGGQQFERAANDPLLARMLGAITLELDTNMTPCPPAMAMQMIAGMGAVPITAEAGETGFKRVAALGLSVAIPEEMNGSLNAAGLHFMNGPNRLSVRLATHGPRGPLSAAAMSEMTHLGTRDLGAAGVFEVYVRNQTGLYRRNYSVHETWVISQTAGPDGIVGLHILNEGDGLPDWPELEPLHRLLVEMLRASDG